MLKSIFATAVLSGVFSFGVKAHAVDFVVDVLTERYTGLSSVDTKNISGDTKSISKDTSDIAGSTKSIDGTTTNLYNGFFKDQPDTSVFPDLSDASVQNSMPDADQVGPQMAGTGSPASGYATTFYNNNMIYKTQLNDADGQRLNNAVVTSANIQGMAAHNLGAIEARLAKLEDMRTAIDGATDIKQITALNGRIAIEAVAIEAQEAQAQNLVALATAQTQVNLQAQQQMVRQAHEQTQSEFSQLQLP